MKETVGTYIDLPKDLREKIDELRQNEGRSLKQTVIRLIKEGLKSQAA